MYREKCKSQVLDLFQIKREVLELYGFPNELDERLFGGEAVSGTNLLKLIVDFLFKAEGNFYLSGG